MPRGRRYRLVLRGELSDRLGALFEGMQMQRHAGTTSLTGWVVDQVQLVGLIERAQELGLELVSIGPDEGPTPVRRIPRPSRERLDG